MVSKIYPRFVTFFASLLFALTVVSPALALEPATENAGSSAGTVAGEPVKLDEETESLQPAEPRIILRSDGEVDPFGEPLDEHAPSIRELQQEFRLQLSDMRNRFAEQQSRIDLLEKRQNLPESVGMLLDSGYRFSLGGELEMELIYTENSTHAAGATVESRPRFHIDQLWLYPRIDFTEDRDRYVRAELRFDPDGSRLDELTVVFEDLLVSSYIQFGLDDRFEAPEEDERITEDEILIETAFFRHETLVARWAQERGPLIWNLSIGNPPLIGVDYATEDQSYPMLSRVRNTGATRRPEFGMLLGYRFYDPLLGDLTASPYFYFAELNRADVTFLKNNIPNYTSNSLTSRTVGLVGKYLNWGMQLDGQYVREYIGDIQRDGYYVQGAYRIELHGIVWKSHRFFRGLQAVIRYASLWSNMTAYSDSSLTWDRTKWTFAGVFDVLDNWKLKLEYTINRENVPSGSPDNDEMLAQVEISF
ncbi:MAG: hypothetical protein NUW37_15815 [Planctomycetes bacterium]|nr:hypothetical protein [Planctomycetota bacterium]